MVSHFKSPLCSLCPSSCISNFSLLNSVLLHLSYMSHGSLLYYTQFDDEDKWIQTLKEQEVDIWRSKCKWAWCKCNNALWGVTGNCSTEFIILVYRDFSSLHFQQTWSNVHVELCLNYSPTFTPLLALFWSPPTIIFGSLAAARCSTFYTS